MGYKNIKEILPDELIKQIQKYIEKMSIFLERMKIGNVGEMALLQEC